MAITPEEVADLVAGAACGDEAAAIALWERVVRHLDKRTQDDYGRFVRRLAYRFRDVRRILGDPGNN